LNPNPLTRPGEGVTQVVPDHRALGDR
jgi:hypothetical protein